MRVPTWIYFLIFIGLLIGNVKVYQTIFAEPVLKVAILEAGKSNAVLVKSPGGNTVLIDTGSDASILRALGGALPMWQRKIDAIILTSAAASNAGGLPEVQDRYRVGTLIRSATRGDRFALGGDAYADILWPPKTISPMSPADSVMVIRISYGITSFLIQKNLPLRISTYLATLDSNQPPPDLIISSSTPAGIYTSNGEIVIKN